MMATRQAEATTSGRASASSSEARSVCAFIRTSSSGVTCFMRIRLERKVNRSPGTTRSRASSIRGNSVSMVRLELGTIMPIRRSRTGPPRDVPGPPGYPRAARVTRGRGPSSAGDRLALRLDPHDDPLALDVLRGVGPAVVLLGELVDLVACPLPPLGLHDPAPDLGVPVGVRLVADGQGHPRVLLEVLELLPVRLGFHVEPIAVGAHPDVLGLDPVARQQAADGGVVGAAGQLAGDRVQVGTVLGVSHADALPPGADQHATRRAGPAPSHVAPPGASAQGEPATLRAAVRVDAELAEQVGVADGVDGDVELLLGPPGLLGAPGGTQHLDDVAAVDVHRWLLGSVRE